MITDRETNFVYFAQGLKEKYRPFFRKLEKILNHHRIRHGFLSSNDEWCRDYMPIQISNNRFKKFKYNPVYKPKTDATPICVHIGIEAEPSKVVIDGGNVIKSKTKVIMTKRVIKKNKHNYNKDELIKKLKKVLRVKQVILIPQNKHDKFGHADGMVRFLDGAKDENKVLVSDYSNEPAFEKKLHKALTDAGLEPMPVRIPYSPKPKAKLNASGVYINYLQIGKFVIYPEFGIESDKKAREVFSGYFRGNAVPIKSSELNKIAKKGGVLNCISWNIKR